MLAVVLAMLPWAIVRAITDQGSDYLDFVNSAAFILEHGLRHPCTALNRYLPSVDVAFMPFTILPAALGATLYYLLNVGSWFGLLSTVRRGLLSGSNADEADRGTMAAALMALVIAADGFLVGAFHVLMVWLMVAGLVQVSQGRNGRGGLLLGLATWLKLLPAIGIAYLLLKRKWRAALVAIAVVFALDVALSLPAYGPTGAWREHVAFVEAGAVGTVHDQMDGTTWVDEDRITNQSTMVILRRLLTLRGGFPELAIADLGSRELTVVSATMLLSLAAAIALALRRPGHELTPAEWGGEIALLLLCTVWFSPVVWSYHPTAVVPALALIMSQPRFERSKRVVTLFWIVGVALFTVPLARAAGHMLLTSCFLGAVLLWTMHRNRALLLGSSRPRARFIHLRPLAHQLPSGGFATSGSSGV